MAPPGSANLHVGGSPVFLIGQSYRHGTLQQGDTRLRFPQNPEPYDTPAQFGFGAKLNTNNPDWKVCTDYLTLAEGQKEIESGCSSSTSHPCDLRPTSSMRESSRSSPRRLEWCKLPFEFFDRTALAVE